MAEAYSKDELDRRMNGAVATLKSELGGLRTGRASAALLDPVKVEAYGNVVPINQVGTIPLPELNEERRRELTKLAAKYAEAARVAVRNVRRDGMDLLKRLEKDHKISQDDQHTKGDELQKLTD